jgi:hypothetical protein
MTYPHSDKSLHFAGAKQRDLKIPHFFPEKNSTFPKFATFVSRFKIPGERSFDLALATFLAASLCCSPIGKSEPLSPLKVPGGGNHYSWQISVQPDVLLVGSPHSSWLYAYSRRGELLWKRPIDWPLIQAPRMWEGLLLLQQAGQPAWLLQPQTGELRQRLPREFSGWTLPWDNQRWIQLGEQGEVRLGTRDWTQWVTLGQLRLDRGDAWMGPPAVARSYLFVTTKLGHLQRLGPIEDVLPAASAKQDSPLPSEGIRSKLDFTRSDTDSETDEAPDASAPETADSNDALNRGRVRGLRVRQLPGVGRPLFGPLAHPRGVVEVSLDGKVTLRRRQNPWVQRFPGWDSCYSLQGRLLPRPALDSEGNIFLATRDSIHAWNGDTGQVLWNQPTRSATPVQVHGNSVWTVVDDPPALLELSTRTGEFKQRIDLPAGPASELSVGSDLLALVLRDGTILTRALAPASSDGER